MPTDVSGLLLNVAASIERQLDVDHWVYYFVDDVSVWPGLDGNVLDEMERKLVRRVDRVVWVSETMQQRIGGMGEGSQLLTHGIDLSHWRSRIPSETHATFRHALEDLCPKLR